MNIFDAIIDHFRTNHAVTGIGDAVLIQWGGLVLIWLIIAYWHQHQNEVFHQYIRNANKRTPISDRLSQVAHSRAFEVPAIFFVFILTVLYYDTKLHKIAETYKTNQQNLTLMEQEINTLEKALSETQEALKRHAPPESTELALDTLKQKYEELFINYYYLKRCNRILPRDFHLMSAALTHELSMLNAPLIIRKNILSAAKGTHDEMYASMECKEDIALPMQNKIAAYLQTVIQNLPDH